jgi:hypothetical protein
MFAVPNYSCDFGKHLGAALSTPFVLTLASCAAAAALLLLTV